MIEFDTIPASIRKPGVYIEFNTKLAVRNLPTNKQSICLIVPLGAAATLLPHVPTPVYDPIEAKTLTDSAVAEEMVRAVIKSYRYAALSIV
ncbi:phage tail protein, partial [Pseudomonas chlororaphis]|nr:phage tail protein [Pseudomonas chlororaphis]